MKITLVPHLEFRLKIRKIPRSYPKLIFQKPDQKFLDAETGHKIAIKRLEYNEKVRPLVISYDIIEKEIEIITIHPISEKEIENRVKRERWINDEED